MRISSQANISFLRPFCLAMETINGLYNLFHMLKIFIKRLVNGVKSICKAFILTIYVKDASLNVLQTSNNIVTYFW